MKLKIPKLRLRKKVRASTSRRSALAARAVDYEEMSEPNMKLSRALLIVLVLHVVAVAGIIAFNSIKTHERPSLSRTSVAPAKPAATAVAKPDLTAQSAMVETSAPKHERGKPAHSPARATAKEERKAVPAKPADSGTDGSKSYVVIKGDNPVTIAKKFNVSYDELLAINHIDDPYKLQIGQKLRLPEKTLKKKAEE